jgi:hypothetical protein
VSLANMSQKACGAAAVVVKDLEKINKIADEGVNLFQYPKEERIQCRTCLVGKNRDGTMMSSGRVHNLLTDIITEGFSEYVQGVQGRGGRPVQGPPLARHSRARPPNDPGKVRLPEDAVGREPEDMCNDDEMLPSERERALRTPRTSSSVTTRTCATTTRCSPAWCARRV